MAKPKPNPRRRVLTQADVDKAKRKLQAEIDAFQARVDAFQAEKEKIVHDITREAVYGAWAIMFRILKDKRGWRTQSLKRLKAYCDMYARFINDPNDPLTLDDIYQTLLDEDQIRFDGIKYQEESNESKT